MTARSPAELQAQLGEGKVDVVVDNKQLVLADVEVVQQGCDDLAGVIHGNVGKDQLSRIVPDAELRHERSDPAAGPLEPEFVALGDSSNGFSTDVVTRAFEFGLGIAEPNDEAQLTLRFRLSGFFALGRLGSLDGLAVFAELDGLDGQTLFVQLDRNFGLGLDAGRLHREERRAGVV